MRIENQKMQTLSMVNRTDCKGMRKMDTREEKYWKKFENSGRIEDYLSFISGTQASEGEYAGTYRSNRDYIEAVSGGRIRQTYQPFD